jgi:hypothetical protein
VSIDSVEGQVRQLPRWLSTASFDELVQFGHSQSGSQIRSQFGFEGLITFVHQEGAAEELR